jgi:hypothetical protein
MKQDFVNGKERKHKKFNLILFTNVKNVMILKRKKSINLRRVIMGDKSKIESYIHPSNKSDSMKKNKSSLEVVTGSKGSHELGNESHLDSLMGEPHGADISGHTGKMKW